MAKGKRTLDLSPGDKINKSVHAINSWFGVFGIIFIIGTGFIQHLILNHLPPALSLNEASKYPDKFIGERAWMDLKKLTDIGPRVRGTYANEVLAVKFFKDSVANIVNTKHSAQNIILDHQIVSGSFSTGWKKQVFTNMYRNAQNIVVKLEGKQQETALLLNCHFDSVATSPGASDDGGSCAVMLEILRVLSRQPEVNTNSIIFLFNGAEETGLMGSHGFITKHKWAKDIRAFINLESAGSGGKEILFQSGPKNPWLLKMYAESVIHPFAHAAGEEIFQSELIPSDTDFRIFRDFGHIPGFDMAHMMNGFRYHTKFDTIDYISVEVLQRTGDNVLALTKALSNADELENTKSHTNGHTVFFDFMGLFIVHYSRDFGMVLNLAIVLAAIWVGYSSLMHATNSTSGESIRSEIVMGFVCTALSFGFSYYLCHFIAVAMDFFGRAMFWYTTTRLIIGVYGFPAALTHVLIHNFSETIYKSKRLSLALRVQARLVGVSVFWSVITLIISFSGYRIAYICSVLILFHLASMSIIWLFRLQNTVHKWLVVHLFFQVLAILWTSQFYNILIKLFVPISGRSGGKNNIELSISVLATFSTILACSYMISLLHLLRRKSKLFNALIVVSLISIVLASFTTLGFPYRDEIGQDPTPQRHYFTHTSRIFYDAEGQVRSRDSGFLLRQLDRNSEKNILDLTKSFNEITPQFELDSCKNEVFCALPFYSFFHQFNYKGFWIPAEEPNTDGAITLGLDSVLRTSGNTISMSFNLKGSIQSSLMIRPKPGILLVNWNLLDYVPDKIELNGELAYFVVITHSVDSGDIEFNLDFRSENGTELITGKGELVDVTVITTFWKFEKQHDSFTNLISLVPEWGHVVPSVAQVNVYTF